MKLPESIPLLRDGASAGVDKGVDLSGFILLTLLTLLTLAVALAIVAWRNRDKWQRNANQDTAQPSAWTRWLVPNQRSSLKVLGTVHLPGKHSVHEVEWRGKHLLIGCSSQSIQLLAEAPPVCTPTQDSGT
jgi:flagellar protein FliO/FliZ